MFQQVDYLMVAVSDMQRSVRFYQDMLGLPLKFESPGWSEFKTGSTTLALHGGGKMKPANSRGHGAEMIAGTCAFGFNANNIDQVYDELRSKGVQFAMPPTERREEGIKLCVLLDPDGLAISLAENLSK